MKNFETISLSKNESSNIKGGHKGFFYKLGHFWASSVLVVAGTLAGISDGFSDGVSND